ncbi:MAG: hypothetical protein KatS3mg015_2674 [Fimbriimonadales bacterium]|nr:MAG: hypothetical protein KatS3mg015_2674 [Fimbriimonadales bacterium]
MDRSLLRDYAPDAVTVEEVQANALKMQNAFARANAAARASAEAGRFRQAALEAQIAGDTRAAEAAEWNRQRLSPLRAVASGDPQGFDEARSSGRLDDYMLGVLGSAAASMERPLAYGAAGSLLGPLGAAAGAYKGSFDEIRPAELEGYAADSELAALSPERQLELSRTSALAQAAPEAVLPTYFALGGRLPKALGTVPRGLRTLGATVGEAGTEGLQSYIGQRVVQQEFPDREIDWGDVKENAIAGAIGGGGLAALVGPGPATSDEQGGGSAPIDLNPPSAPMEGAPPGTPLLPGPEDGSGGGVGVGDLFDTLNERFGPGIREQAQRTKDYVSDTIDRMTEAAKTAQSPSDFLRQVFGNSSEEAAADLRPDTEDPIVLNAPDPAAALMQRDAERQQRAARFAEELLSDPATPAMIKDRVTSFGGDFSSREAQEFVARNLVALRAGEKLANAVADLIDLAKDFGSKAAEAGADLAGKARDMLDKGMTAAANRIVKKNLQDINEADIAPLVTLMAQRLGPAKAAEAPKLARQLVAAANRLSPDARITEEIDRRLRNFSTVVDDEVLDLVTELSGSDALRNTIAKIRSIPSAASDVRRSGGQSFLESMLKQPLSPGVLSQLAELVDVLGLQLDSMPSERKNRVLAGLAAAFGSKREAQIVVEYYGNIRRDALRRAAERGDYGPDVDVEGDAAPGDVRYDPNETRREDGSNPMKEVDAPKASYQFADAKAMRPFRAFVGSELAGGKRRRESVQAAINLKGVNPAARVRPIKMSQYVADTGRIPEAEVRRIANDIKDRIEQHKARKDEDRTKQINELQGELALLRQAYKNGGAQAALDLYEVLEVSGQEQNDTIATDEDIAKMAMLVDAKDAKETRVTFQREDGSKFTLSAESMWKTMGDKEGSGKGENAQARAKRLFADAVASVLARPEVVKMVTPMEKILIDRKLGVRAKKKDNPKYRKMVADALKAAEGSLKQLEATLDAVVDEYLEAADNEAKSEEYGSRREEIEAIIDQNIARLSERLDAAREGEGPLAGNLPAQAVARKRLRMYREARNQIDAIKFDEEFDERDNNRSGVPGADETGPIGPYGLPRTRMNEELSNPGPRYYEENTGLGIGVERRVPKTETSAENKPARVILPQVSRYAAKDQAKSDKGSAKPEARLQEPEPGQPGSREAPHRIPMYYKIGNVLRLRKELRDSYSSSDSISALIERGDKTGTTRQPPRGVLPGHYITFPGVKGLYRVTGFEKIDLLSDAGREAWSKREGWAPEAADTFGSQVQHGKIQMQFERVDTSQPSQRKHPTEEQEGAPKPKTISEAAVNALYDIAVKGNFSRLNTPEKVLRYAAMARAALDQLGQIPEDARTAMQDELLTKLRADFGQSGSSAFDWDMLFDGMKPTAEQRALLEDLVTKKSAMGAKKGRPGKIDTQKILDEIYRIRGNKVKVIFQTFSQIGGSGEYSINKDKTIRLIKIAVNAANPMGVAWHESLHDFFAMLDEDRVGRSIKKDLIDAANAPQVKKRLRELLAEHPEALKQIEESPEERVAYMYQFWAEGLLRLGPTGTGIFERLRQLFRDLLGLISTEQRAADLLTALHEGRFAEPSTVAEVLADMPGDRFSNKMEKAAPALTAALSKVFQTAPDRLRAYHNDKLNELADMFSSERGKLGFIQRRFQQQGVWENKLAGVLAGTTAQERRAALENLQAMKPPSTKLEKDLANFFSEMYDYMTEAGVKTLDSKTKKWVPLRKVKNYFPRVFDRDKIMEDRAGFISLLQKHGNMSLKQANAVVDALVHGTGQLELAENEHALGFTPYAQAVQDRQLTFINPSNAADFAKYQVKDLADVTTSYVKQAVHRAEYARMFGNDGEVIAKMISESGIKNRKELEDIGKIVQGLEGSLGYDMSTETKELMSGIMTLQNLVVLPLAIFSQMIDPIVLAARSGELKDAGTAYMTAIKRLMGKKVDGEELAKMLGIISQDSVLEAMGAAYGTVYMSKRMRDINRVFFKYNGMQGWNNSMRIAATAAGERYLIANKDNDRALAELGLTSKDVKVDKNGRLDVSNPKVQEAMYRFVDQAVLRPSASNRPVWMSDPRFLLVAHLKQFSFAMHNVVLKRANRELADGNPKPWVILMLTAPVILAVDMAKFALTGTAPSTWGFKDYLVHAVERSGLLGLGDFGVQAMRGVDMGKVPGEGLLGPTFEHLMEILRWIGGDPRTDFGDVIDRTVPGARFI